MKKITLVLTILLAVSFAAHAAPPTNTVGSANIMGYTKISLPSDSYFLAGASFVDAPDGSVDVASLLGTDILSGHYLPANADKVHVWTSNQVYLTLGLYDDTGVGGSTTEWRDTSDFYGPAASAIISCSEGFWVESTSSSPSNTILVSGDVVLLTNTTNDIVPGFQILSYPFSSDRAITSLTFIADGALGDVFPASADKIHVFNTGTSTYDVYGFYDDSGYGGSTKEWRNTSDFYGSATPATVNLAKGFWYEAQTNFTWIEDNPYLSVIE